MDKKNLRTIKIRVTAQTLWHLEQLAALCGWGEKDLGRVIDKIIRSYCADKAERRKNERKRSKAD